MLVWPIPKKLKLFHSPRNLQGAFKYLCPNISPLLYMCTASFMTYHKAKTILALVPLPSSFPLFPPFFGDKSDSSHFLNRIQHILSPSVVISSLPIQHARSYTAVLLLHGLPQPKNLKHQRDGKLQALSWGQDMQNWSPHASPIALLCYSNIIHFYLKKL